MKLNRGMLLAAAATFVVGALAVGSYGSLPGNDPEVVGPEQTATNEAAVTDTSNPGVEEDAFHGGGHVGGGFHGGARGFGEGRGGFGHRGWGHEGRWGEGRWGRWGGGRWTGGRWANGPYWGWCDARYYDCRRHWW